MLFYILTAFLESLSKKCCVRRFECGDALVELEFRLVDLIQYLSERKLSMEGFHSDLELTSKAAFRIGSVFA